MERTDQIFVSRPKAAEMAGVSLATLKRLIRRGVLEEVKFTPEGHPRVRVEDIRSLGRRDERAP